MNVRVYRRVEAQQYSFFTPALHKREWSVSRPNRLTPSRSSWYLPNMWLGGPQSRGRRFGEEKYLVSCRESNQDSSGAQITAYHNIVTKYSHHCVL